MFTNLSFVSLAYIYANIVGYVFHFIVSRRLGPVEYGEFMVLYSFMLTVGNFSSIVSVVSVKYIIENPFKIETLNFFRRLTIKLGLLILGIGIAASPILKIFFKVSSAFYFLIVFINIFFMLIIAVERGMLQVNGFFFKYAFSIVLELTFRLIAVLILLYSGFKISGAIGSTLIGLLLALLYVLNINRNLQSKTLKLPLKKIVKTALYISPAGFLIYADGMFIKKIFSPEMAGLYASATILGKVVLMFVITLFSVFFPELVKRKERGGFDITFKKFSLNIAFIITTIYLVSIVGIILIGKPLYIFLFGERYLKGFSFLLPYVIATYPLALSVLFINIFTVLHKNIKIIYSHLIFYYFILFLVSFTHLSVKKYIFIIGVANLFFVFIYTYLFGNSKIYYSEKN